MASGDQTVQMLSDFMDAWNRHDVDGVMTFFGPEPTYHASFGPDDNGTTFSGEAEVRRGVEAFLGTFPDGHYSDIVAFASGDRAAAQWSFAGTRTDGTRIAYRGCDLFTLSEGRITLKDAFRKERAGALT